MHLKALTMVEVGYLSRRENISVRETLERLKQSGVDSMPGGGAEIFSERVRRIICDHKIDGDEWIETARTAHRIGLKSNATMLYGHIETEEDRIDHLIRLRALQDDTGGFQTYIPLAFHPENTPMRHMPMTSGFQDIKAIAVARLMLDNFPHVKAYWIMMTPKIAQVAQRFGADDIDGTVVEEKIYHDAGAQTAQSLRRGQLLRLIERAGREPVERDTLYRRRLARRGGIHRSGVVAFLSAEPSGSRSRIARNSFLISVRASVSIFLPAASRFLLPGGGRGFLLLPDAFPERLAGACDGVAFVVEQALDLQHRLDVFATVPPLPVRCFLGRKRRKLAFPKAQDVGFHAGQSAHVADAKKQAVGYLRGFRRNLLSVRHRIRIPSRSAAAQPGGARSLREYQTALIRLWVLKFGKSMRLPDRPFSGNPAAVCLLPAWRADSWLQAVAAEMNLSETAFLVPRGEAFELRWFTPALEVELCGHATLASAHYLWASGRLSPDAAARFHTHSGALTARRRKGAIEMDFPATAGRSRRTARGTDRRARLRARFRPPRRRGSAGRSGIGGKRSGRSVRTFPRWPGSTPAASSSPRRAAALATSSPAFSRPPPASTKTP